MSPTAHTTKSDASPTISRRNVNRTRGSLMAGPPSRRVTDGEDHGADETPDDAVPQPEGRQHLGRLEERGPATRGPALPIRRREERQRRRDDGDADQEPPDRELMPPHGGASPGL